jgi:secreted PhoX family phosphatase
MHRRSFLRSAAAATASISFSAFATRVAAKPRPQGVGYGPLLPTVDESTGLPLLSLPDGFRYLSFGWTGDTMVDSNPTPGAHDGMAAFHWHGHRIRLVRNHELDLAAAFSPVAYDIGAAGGTTTIEFDDKTGEYLGTVPSLSGTARNCAGGPSLEGSWLTCE